MCGRTSDDRGGLRAAVKEYNRGEWYTVNFEGGEGGIFCSVGVERRDSVGIFIYLFPNEFLAYIVSLSFEIRLNHHPSRI